VLVCPLTPRLRLADLSPEETADLFTTVQRVQRMLARRYFEPLASSSSAPAASPAARNGSFNVAIQDGPDAGQTVPHLHVHILPRPAGSTDGMTPGTQGNAVYEDMTLEDGNIGGALWDVEMGKRPAPGGAYAKVDDESRKPRTMKEMVLEAEEYKRLLDEIERE
jgi:diadenosine tetraphosphate (Ap4A) HIT family hydrolase